MILSDGGSRRVAYVGDDADAVRAALADGPGREYRVDAVADADAAADLVGDGATACVIADHDGPDSPALSLLEEGSPGVDGSTSPPLVALVGEGDPSAVLAAGVADYVDAVALSERPGIVERRVLEAVADRSGAWYETLLEHESDYVFVLDDEGRIRYQSPSVERILGYEPGELVGEDAFERVHEDDRERVSAAFASVLAAEGDAVESVECRVRDASGEWRWIESVGRNRTDSVLGGFVVSSRVIDERKDRQRRLERAETVFQNVRDGVFLVDVDENRRFEVRRVNEAYEDVTGLSLAEMRGKTPTEILGDEIGRQIEAKLAECADRQTPLDYEEAFDVPDLPTYWHTRLAPVVVDGEVERVVGATRDVTERKERESELRLKTRAMDEAPIGITIADVQRPGSPIIDVNEGFEELTGYDAHEVRGRTWTFLRGAETDDAALREANAALDRGKATAAELLLYRADGTPFWSRVSLAPVGDGDGEVTHVVGFQQDVTERKEYEQEIERRFDEFGEVLADDLREPIEAARDHLRSARTDGDEDLAAVGDCLDRADTLLEQIATVHSYAVTSRSTAEDALAGTRGDDG